MFGGRSADTIIPVIDGVLEQTIHETQTSIALILPVEQIDLPLSRILVLALALLKRTLHRLVQFRCPLLSGFFPIFFLLWLLYSACLTGCLGGERRRVEDEVTVRWPEVVRDVILLVLLTRVRELVLRVVFSGLSISVVMVLVLLSFCSNSGVSVRVLHCVPWLPPFLLLFLSIPGVKPIWLRVFRGEWTRCVRS